MKNDEKKHVIHKERTMWRTLYAIGGINENDRIDVYMADYDKESIKNGMIKRYGSFKGSDELVSTFWLFNPERKFMLLSIEINTLDKNMDDVSEPGRIINILEV